MVITVSQINAYIKSSFDSDSKLKNIFLKGEISNLKNHYQSGHIYFSLKDDSSVIRAVMFSGSAKRVRPVLEDGMKVVLRGTVSLYEPSGQYQIYVDDIHPDGIGEMYLEFHQIKEKLVLEGIFDIERKKNVPHYPSVVGVITSLSGAVIHDIKNVIGRRYPICEIRIFPVSVQGSESSNKIINAVNYINKKKAADIIIIARGGGSIEDLWCFNNEELARTVSNSDIPIISAVGHETDFTICDFAADLRASTPSVAAEMAVPDIRNLKMDIDCIHEKITKLTMNYIGVFRNKIDYKKSGFSSLIRHNKIDEYKNHLKLIKNNIYNVSTSNIQLKVLTLNQYKNKLNILNPSKVLSRGFAHVSSDGGTILSAGQMSPGENLKVTFLDGEVECYVNSVRRNNI